VDRYDVATQQPVHSNVVFGVLGSSPSGSDARTERVSPSGDNTHRESTAEGLVVVGADGSRHPLTAAAPVVLPLAAFSVQSMQS
jgi:hypothetical protein